MLSGAYPDRVGSAFKEVEKNIHRTQMCMPLKPVFSRHKRDGVQITDEPTGALDSNSSAMLLHTLQIMNRELGATILMVTHDVFSACYCEKILFLRDGKICSELERGNMGKKEYLNRILDMQSKIGGDDVYVE